MRALLLVTSCLWCLAAWAQCPSGEIPDCNGNCHPADWVGDGVCDDGISYPSDFMCPEFGWDGGDCSECGGGMVLDCNGNCAAFSLIGNGICNNSDIVNFACSQYDWDGGDCPVVCPEGQFADCSNQCWNNGILDFVGDWHCHSGEWGGGGWMYGYVSLDLNCAAFDFDGCDCIFSGCTDPAATNFYQHATEDDGSCQYECPPGTTDCMGACVPEDWIGANACAEEPSDQPLEHLFEGAYPAVLESVIPVGAPTRGVCVLPDGSAAFAATDAGFVRISLTEQGACGAIETFASSALYTVAPTIGGDFVVGASYGDGGVHILDVAAEEVMGFVPTGGGALKVRASANGEWVAVSNHNDHTVSVLDPEDWSEIANFAVGENPRNIAFSPGDSLLYVANWSSFSLGVYATGSWALIEEVEVDYWPQAVWPTPDGDYVLVANFGFDHSYDHISVIRTADWQVIARLQTGAGPEDMMTIGPNGEYLYVTNWGMSCCFHTVGLSCCADEINDGTATIIALPDFDALVPPDEIPDDIPYIQSTLMTVPLEGAYSFGMAASADGTNVFVSNRDSESVSVLGLGMQLLPGDDCDNALPLQAPAFCLDGCTAGYTDQYNEACPFEATGGADRVYRLDPLVTDTVNLDMCTSQFDTKIYIYEGACGSMNSETAIYCNDDACGVNGWRSRLENVVLEAGQTYFLIIDGYGAMDQGDFTLCFESDCPGDLDNDGHVQLSDLLIFLQGFAWQFDTADLLEFTGLFGAACD